MIIWELQLRLLQPPVRRSTRAPHPCRRLGWFSIPTWSEETTVEIEPSVAHWLVLGGGLQRDRSDAGCHVQTGIPLDAERLKRNRPI